MNTDQFWQLIDDVHVASGGDMDRKCELLTARLRALPYEDLRSFRAEFEGADIAAYSWGVWGAIYTLCEGCSDDKFDDFRATLISCGRATFEKVIGDPDSLADVALPDDPCYEGYQYVPTEVETQVLGQPVDRVDWPSEPSGDEWDDSEEELARLYPRITKLIEPAKLKRASRRASRASDSVLAHWFHLITYDIFRR